MPVGMPYPRPVRPPLLRFIALLLMLVLLALTPALAQVQTAVGQVDYVQGLASAQNGNAAPRFLNKGDAVLEGDVISTGARSFIVIAFNDGTKTTLRPNTVFAVDRFSQVKESEAAVFRLLKGGLRAITGAIAKASPHSVRLSTSTATIGIRGTSFDTRICAADCATERQPGRDGSQPATQIVARVATLDGKSVVLDAKGRSHPVTAGMPLFNGETVRTEKGAWTALAFRDQSMVTVTGDSEFKLENVQFSGAQSDNGSFVVRLLRGGARAVTGLLARRAPDSVKFRAATATVGIRGTGFDQRIALDCVAPGNCAEAVFAHVWEGAVALESGTQSLPIPLGRAAVFNATHNKLILLDAVPQFFLDEPAPRPDTLMMDFDKLFAATRLDSPSAGVYSFVRDGRIHFAGPKAGIDVGPGEAGFLADGSDTPVRLSVVPRFLSEDPIPAPDQLNEQTLRLLDVLNPGGRPGDVICEM